ncbi:MAG: hypothetical protein AAF618_02110 [Pseudomonadota bacterium]
MTIIDILILNMGYGDNGQRVLGQVKFLLERGTGKPESLTMSCSVPISARIRPDALLIGDAVRQLRRTPEIRSGAARLKFARGLRPLPAQDAA